MIPNIKIEQQQKKNFTCFLGQFIHLEWLKCEWISLCLNNVYMSGSETDHSTQFCIFFSSVSVPFVDFREHFKAGFTCIRIMSNFSQRFKCHFIIINYVICVQYLWSCHRSKMNGTHTYTPKNRISVEYCWCRWVIIGTLKLCKMIYFEWQTPTLFRFGSTFNSPSDVYLEAINSFIKLEITPNGTMINWYCPTRFVFMVTVYAHCTYKINWALYVLSQNMCVSHFVEWFFSHFSAQPINIFTSIEMKRVPDIA